MSDVRIEVHKLLGWKHLHQRWVPTPDGGLAFETRTIHYGPGPDGIWRRTESPWEQYGVLVYDDAPPPARGVLEA